MGFALGKSLGAALPVLRKVKTLSIQTLLLPLRLPLPLQSLFKESALGRFFHRVAMSVYVCMYLSLFM